MAYREKGNSWGNGLTRGSGPTSSEKIPPAASPPDGEDSALLHSFLLSPPDPLRWAPAGAPIGWFIERRQSRKKADTYPLPPGERQRKEEGVHSVTSKTPARTTPRAEDMRKKRRQALRVPRPSSPRRGVTSFSLLDRARPVFSFSSGRKRENGGCIAPAIAGIQSPPPEGPEKNPPPGRGEDKGAPYGILPPSP